MKKVLILGGAGFVGYNLINTIPNKYQIEVWDNLSRGKQDFFFKAILKKRKIKLKKVNINNKVNLRLISNYDYIFFLIATVGVENVNKDPYFTFFNNFNGLYKIVNQLKKKQAKTKLIFFSTSEVYSNNYRFNFSKIPFKEKENILIPSQILGRDSYFLSKIFAEKLCQISNIDYICFRLHNIYGPRMGNSHVIPQLIDKFLKFNNKAVKVFSPNHTRSFCYIDDAIKQILLISFKKNTKYKTYNIGNDTEEIKIYDLAKTIKKIIISKKKTSKMRNNSWIPKKKKAIY